MLQINGILFAIAGVCFGLAILYIRKKPDRHWVAYSISLFITGAVFLLGEILILIS